MSWLKDKLRSMAMSRAGAPPAVLPPPVEKPRRPKAKPAPDPTLPPEGVEPRLWREALRNEMMGSPRSNIRRGSDVPSDETVRREHAFAATMQRRERQQQRYRNQFAVDPITGRSNIR
jgi:hypothetical protein